MPLLYLELHRPDAKSPNGYFSITWPSPLMNYQGSVALSNFYDRLKKYYREPNRAEKFHESAIDVIGEDCEFQLTFGPQIGDLNGAEKDDSELECKVRAFTGSLKFEPGFEEPLSLVLSQDANIPSDFSFVRINNPYCGLYFGGHDYRTLGVDSEYSFPSELVGLFKATGLHQLRAGESTLLISKLEELLAHMPRLEAKQ